MRAAVIQLNSTADKARNLERARRLVAEAAAAGAELVVLPEKWNLLSANAAEGAEELASSPTLAAAARLGPRALGIDLLAGSIAERVEGSESSFNTRCLIDRRRRARRQLPQDPHVRRRGRRGQLPRVRARAAPATRSSAPTAAGVRGRADRLLRPALSRSSTGSSPCAALACSPSPRRSRCRPGATTGRCCCAPGRSRTRLSSSPPNQVGKAPPHYELLRPLDDRRPLGHGAGARSRTARASPSPTSTSSARTQIRASLPSLANRRPGRLPLAGSGRGA